MPAYYITIHFIVILNCRKLLQILIVYIKNGKIYTIVLTVRPMQCPRRRQKINKRSGTNEKEKRYFSDCLHFMRPYAFYGLFFRQGNGQHTFGQLRGPHSRAAGIPQ